MRIDAIYENGKLFFKQPVRLSSQPIEVQLAVPDEAVIQETTVPASQKKPEQTTDPSPIRRQLDAIMGQHAKRRPRTTYAEDKKAWQNYLNEKYGQ